MKMLVAALVAASLATGTPGPQHDAVRKGVLAYEALDYRTARAVLEEILDTGRLGEDDRIVALAYLARGLAVLGKGHAAQRRFVQLLDLVPTYTVPRNESPRIREAFEAAQLELRERPPPVKRPRPAGPGAKKPTGDGAQTPPAGPGANALSADRGGKKHSSSPEGKRVPARLRPKKVPSRLNEVTATAAATGVKRFGPTEPTTETEKPWGGETMWAGAAIIAGAAVAAITLVIVLRGDSSDEPMARWRVP